MSGPEWNELERLWQSLPEEAAPAITELKRMKRTRWLSVALAAGDAIMTLIGVVVGVWFVVQGGVYFTVMGVAAVVLALFVGGLSFWARRVAQVRADDPVQTALALAIRRAQIGVRLAVAVLWSVGAGMLFVALAAIMRATNGDISPAGGRMMLLTIGFTLVWLVVALAGALIYRDRRQADLSRLLAIKDGLQT